MTGWGQKLSELDVDDLQRALRETDDAKAAKRLVVALAYKHGDSPAAIERRFGFPEGTVYDWLDRLAERGIAAGASDDKRPGRPPKLSSADAVALEAVLTESPTAAGFDASRWTPALVQEWLATARDIEYSRRHVRRLLADRDLTDSSTETP